MRHMIIIALLSPIAFADQITIPFLLTNNTVADAMDINANIEALLTESNENDARITNLETILKVDEAELNLSVGSTLPNIRPDVGNDLIASQNTAVGIATLHNTTTGFNNTATGYKSLWSNTVGGGNSSYGVYALHNNLGGNANVAVGYKALYLNQSGIANVASGHDALHSNSYGDDNTANGYRAMRQNVSGSFNTASGSKSLLTNITGTYNTGLGYEADVSQDGLSNATAIGNGAVVDASSKVRIGNAEITVIEGQVAFSSSSDARLKDRITPLNEGLALINDLSPVRYHRIHNPSADMEMGLLAQEVAAALDKHGLNASGMVHQSNENAYMSLRYTDLLAPIIRAIQQLDDASDAKDAQIASLQEQLRTEQDELLSIVQYQEEKILIQQEQIAKLQRVVEHQFDVR